MKATRGFTLIELMIVVAIIAILASIAVTVYNDSTAKSQLSEAFTVVDGLKSDVAAHYNQAGSCPSNGSDGIAAATSYSGQYVASAEVKSAASGCQIVAHMRSNTVSSKLRGRTVSFTMSPTDEGTFQWNCSSDAPAVVVPRACQ